MKGWTLAIILVPTAPLTACRHRDPPSPDASPSVAYPDVPAPSDRPVSSVPLTLNVSTVRAPSSAAPVSASDALLPQTHDKPTTASAAFDARVRSLWEAI